MDIEITSLLGVLVSIVGAIAGFYIKALSGKIKTEKLDVITKYAWVAVRAARDTIKQDGRGTDKFNYATTMMRKMVGDRGDIIEDAVRAAYQNLKSETG